MFKQNTTDIQHWIQERNEGHNKFVDEKLEHEIQSHELRTHTEILNQKLQSNQVKLWTTARSSESLLSGHLL